MIKCKQCKELKEPNEFSPTRKVCKVCRRTYSKRHYEMGGREIKLHNYQEKRTEIVKTYRQKVYGVTPEQFDCMLNEQESKCKICNELMTKPCIDHDHKTGKVRYLLCSKCNSGLGFFMDDPVRLLAAAKYLEFCQKN
jgi:hypothetical protein